MAELFRQPDIRYEAERQIEIKAGLPLGTVTIHCPNRTTARKIANVLLTKPGSDGEDEICKLKDIGFLDGPIFGEHQKAVKAVEQMYGSMFTLRLSTLFDTRKSLKHLGRWYLGRLTSTVSSRVAGDLLEE
jgi:hypothetical protein